MEKTKLKALIKLLNVCPTDEIISTILDETIMLIDADLRKKGTGNKKELLKNYKNMLVMGKEFPFLLEILKEKISTFVNLYVSNDVSIIEINSMFDELYKSNNDGCSDFINSIKLAVSYERNIRKVQTQQEDLEIDLEEINERMIGVKGVDITAQKGTSNKSRSEVITNLIYKKDKIQEQINVNKEYIKLLDEQRNKLNSMLKTLDSESNAFITDIIQKGSLETFSMNIINLKRISKKVHKSKA